jgi:WD40 repeat protein
MWDVGTERQLATFPHDNVVRDVVFSPDGYWLATVSDDHTARVWDVSSRRPLATLTHDNVVVNAAFSPDGHWLATASRGKAALIWALGVEGGGD